MAAGGGSASANFAYSDTNTDTKTNSNTNFSQQTQTDATQTGQQKSQTDASQTATGTTNTLSPEILAALSGAATKLGAGITSTDLSGLKQEYIRQFNEDTMGSLNQVAQTTGSQDNSFVQLLKNKAQSDLTTKLYGVDSSNQLGVVNALSGLAGAAKGGTTTSVQTQDSSTTSLMATLNQLLQHVNATGNSQTNTVSNSDTSGWSLGVGAGAG